MARPAKAAEYRKAAERLRGKAVLITDRAIRSQVLKMANLYEELARYFDVKDGQV